MVIAGAELSTGQPHQLGLAEGMIRAVLKTGRISQARLTTPQTSAVVCVPVSSPQIGGVLYLELSEDCVTAAALDDLEWFVDMYTSSVRSKARREDGSATAGPKPTWDLIPALTWTARPDGGLEDANGAWFDYTGLEREAARGFGYTSAFHPDDVEKVIKVWAELRESRKPGGMEARMIRHDGAAHYFALRAVPALDDNGEVIRWYGINTDIDALKRVQFELAKSQLLMDVAQRIIETGTWSWDMTTDVFTCSAECAKIMGLEEAEINFEAINERIHPDDREMVEEAHGRALKGEPLNVEHRFLLPDGTVKYIHARGRLILDDGLKPQAYIGTTVDVTETRLAEDKIRSSLADAQRAQASLAEAQKLSHVGSYQIKPSTGEVTWSEETYNIYGFDPAAPLTSGAILERIHPSDRDRVKSVYEQGIRDRKSWDVEHRLLMPDGSVRHVHCVTRVETGPSEEAKVFGAIIDQTERVRSEEALQRAQADIVRMNRLTTMGAVTVSIAHEINQPLMAIVMNAATCRSWLDRSDPDLGEAMMAAERIIDEGRRAGDVLMNIRSMARNSRPTTMATVAIGDVVEQVLTMLRSELRARQIDVEVRLADDLAPVVGDKVQLQQVLLNLILNAAEATSGGTNDNRLIDVVGANSKAGYIVIGVEDNGEGIDPGTADRIFEPFFSTKQEGTGMGLAISRSIIEAHGGTLSARSRDGGGAVFELSIPFARRGR